MYSVACVDRTMRSQNRDVSVILRAVSSFAANLARGKKPGWYSSPVCLVAPMESPRTVIVCERSGRWVLPLRIALDRAAGRGAAQSNTASAASGNTQPRWNYRLVETRSPDECCAALSSSPRAIAAIELDAAHCDQALALVHTIRERFPDTIIVVLAAYESAEYQWLARELGAAHFVSSPSRLGDFAFLAHRHWESWARPELGTAEQIWATLP